MTHLIHIVGVQARGGKPEADVLVAEWELGIGRKRGDLAGFELAREALVIAPVKMFTIHSESALDLPEYLIKKGLDANVFICSIHSKSSVTL